MMKWWWWIDDDDDYDDELMVSFTAIRQSPKNL